MRKISLLLAIILVMGVLSSSLAPTLIHAQEDEEGWVCPEGYEGQTLSIYNWSTYIAEDTIPNFEELCGVTVTYDIFDSNESLLARLREGNPGYDIIVPSDYMVGTMAAEELLVPLDLEMIPNFANVAETFVNPPYDPDNSYSVPYQWGTIGIGYNIEATGEEITSWEQMWNYDGPVAWLEDPRSMIGIALNYLGYDPNSDDDDEITEAKDFLVENGLNVVAIAADDGQVLLERGDVDMTIEYSGDIFQIMDECECDTYAYVIPAEGSVVWTDNLAIPVDAPNVELAHVFIDYVLDPQVGADIANYTAYGSPNQASLDAGLIDEDYLANPGIYPTEETSERLFLVRENPDTEEIILDAWDEIVIFAGN